MVGSSPPSSPETEYDETPSFSPPRLSSRTPSTAPTTPGSVGTPFSLKSRPTTINLLSAVDFRLSNASSALEKFAVTVSYQDVLWELQLSAEEREYISPHVEPFNKGLLRKHLNHGKSPISSPLILASYFLHHLSRPGLPLEALRVALTAFELHFLSNSNIHSCSLQLEEDSDQVNLLRTYYAALDKVDEPASSVASALIESANNGDAQIYAVFGGQGVANPLCLKDLSYVYSIYGSLLDDLLEISARTLERLASSPKVSSFFRSIDFDINRWIIDPSTIPSLLQVAMAPLSLPITGLLSLAHYCIACKTLGKNPGQLRASFQGVTGHSQGIVVAAAIARSSSWKEFYNSAVFVMEMLFWIGFESHNASNGPSLPAEDAKDSIRAGEGQPSPMLGIRGLDQSILQKLIDEINSQVLKRDRIYMALINSRDNMVVSGPQRSLRGLNLRLRKFRLEENERQVIIQNRFLPISAPFHSPHLEDAAERVLSSLGPSPFTSPLKVGLYHTHTGEDLREVEHYELQNFLISMVMTEMVDWPKASRFKNATHILDFGPGRIGLLQSQLTEGTGVRVILASDIRAVQEDVGSKEELFSSSLPPSAVNWGQFFAPKIDKGPNGKSVLQTKMTRLLKVPPVMIAPNTSNWDFISGVLRAGYHAELAVSDYQNEQDFENAVWKIAQNAPGHRGITFSLLKKSNVPLQLSLLRRLINKGLPIEGLTLGGDIPSPDILRHHVQDLGLKHISFRPTSFRSVLEVVKTAKAHPNFNFGVQWAFDSSDGFNDPIIKAYGQVRKCPNIFLIASNEFRGAEDTYPYLTGEWSETVGYPRMPFDGVILENNMMPAKKLEKNLKFQGEGKVDHKSEKNFDETSEETVTILSRHGEKMYAAATRGALLWKDLDATMFSIMDATKRLAELERRRDEIIERLNKDFQKPWFAVDLMGNNVELGEMTYLEVLHRLVSLMYFRRQNRWIDPSYEKVVLDFSTRARESLVEFSPFQYTAHIEDPFLFLAHFQDSYPNAEDERLRPGDVYYFLALCNRRGLQKAVNFIPSLGEDFEIWFKQDFAWQAENIDAVMDQDRQRVIAIQNPMAKGEIDVLDKCCTEILDGIVESHLEMLRRDMKGGGGGVSA